MSEPLEPCLACAQPDRYAGHTYAIGCALSPLRVPPGLIIYDPVLTAPDGRQYRMTGYTLAAPLPAGDALRWGEDVYSVECRCGALGNETHATDCNEIRKRDPRVDWNAIERLVYDAIVREEITAARGAEILGLRLVTWRDVARGIRQEGAPRE